ncbi:MAG: AMIN domain-containing protein [Alphaproteobacteria bacterium]|nr:AMIN domain-containing protein [Alphaproteobacteria bacterium]
MAGILLVVSRPVAAAERIEGLTLTDEAHRTRIILNLSSAMPYSIFSLADPYRIVIDLPEVAWAAKSRSASSHAGLVSGYRFGLFQPANSRLVLDLARPARITGSYYTQASGGKMRSGLGAQRLVIELEPTSRDGFLQSAGFSQRSHPPLDAKPPAGHGLALPSTPPVKLPVPASPPAVAPVQTGHGLAALAPPPTPGLPHSPPVAVGPALPEQKMTLPQPESRGKRQPIIVIDAGHGGVDPGASTAQGTYEKNIVLDTARRLQKLLRRNGRYKVVMTRDKDVFVRLADRVGIARNSQADLFVSIHADTLSSGKVRGASVYTLSEQASDTEAELLAAKENNSDMIAGIGIGDETDELVKTILIDLAQRETANKSVHFAKLLLPELNDAGSLLKNSHRFAGFRVLKAPDVPSVLVELGLLSNTTDARTLTSDAGRERLAEAIRQAINSYFRDLQT